MVDTITAAMSSWVSSIRLNLWKTNEWKHEKMMKALPSGQNVSSLSCNDLQTALELCKQRSETQGKFLYLQADLCCRARQRKSYLKGQYEVTVL